MHDDVAWDRLMPAIVDSVKHLRYRWTEAGKTIGVGEAVVRTYFDRYDRQDWSTFSPRGANKELLLIYAAKQWPDWRKRFATESPEGDDGRVKGADQGKKGRRQK